jgi:hypothetical protein
MATTTPSEASPTATVQHEFDSGQNQIIADLAKAMRWIAAPLVIIGVLYAIAAVMGVIQSFSRPETLLSVAFVVLATLFYVALGIWTRRAAESFQQITTSSGQDITHLMAALDNLRKKYSLLSFLVKLYVALVIVALVFMLITMIAGAFSG